MLDPGAASAGKKRTAKKLAGMRVTASALLLIVSSLSLTSWGAVRDFAPAPLPPPPTPTINLIQTAGTSNDAAVSSISQSFGSSTVAGDLIVVVVSWGDNAAPTISATDTLKNPYLVATNDYNTSNRQGLAILYASNILPGANTVTVNFGKADHYRRIIISEYSGIATASPLEAIAKNQATATTASNGATSAVGTTTTGGDLIFGAVMDDSGSFGTITAGTGFTRRAVLNNVDTATEDMLQAAAGPIAATFTFGLTDHYLAQMAAFRPAASGTGGTGQFSLACTPTTLASGATSTCTITTTQPAPSGGSAFSLSSSNTSLTVPVSVTVPAGSSSASFSATAGTVTSNQTITVTATSNAYTNKTSSATITVTAAPPPISVSVAPPAASVQVTQTAPFTATVQNDAQNRGVTWSLSGTGCLGTACGTLSSITTTSVTYTAPASAPAPATVTLTATSVTDTSKTSSGTITITAPTPISVTLSPLRSAITTSQSQLFTATVNGTSNSAVNWFVDGIPGGSALAGLITAGGLYTPGTQPGQHLVTASSVVDGTTSAPSTVSVTDLAGIYSWRGTEGDLTRQGVNPKEYALTIGTVNKATFGKLFSCPVDGPLYAQPVYVANLAIPGKGTHNVIFAATENDSVYAYDADSSSCQAVWTTAKVSLLGPGEIPLDASDMFACNDLGDLIGITGTPVIDPGSNTLFVVTRSKDAAANYYQRIHAISLLDGKERAGSPAVIQGSVAGTGDDSNGTSVPFNSRLHNQRPGLVLLNGVVYISWASLCDIDPYHGWVMGYSASTLARVSVFNATPNGARGGIWMSGAAPAADANGFLYLITGNGTFDADTGGQDFGDSFLRLGTTGGLSLVDWFSPFNQDSLNANDRDLGAGGALILVDLPSGPVPHVLVGAGKEGKVYVLNRDSMGGFNSGSDSQIVQSFSVGNAVLATAVFWQNALYLAPISRPMSQFLLNASTGTFNVSPASQSPTSFGFPGSSPSLSASGTTNGIIWGIEYSSTGTAVLHAYDATNLLNELWNSSQAANNRDGAGDAVKFTVPIIANGKVYVGTQAELDVYGLLPN
jgi:hypothetical protein